MRRIDVVHKTKAFLERTPITGAEAEDMVICRQWLSSLEKAAVEAEFGARVGTAPAQVADTSGK